MSFLFEVISNLTLESRIASFINTIHLDTDIKKDVIQEVFDCGYTNNIIAMGQSAVFDFLEDGELLDEDFHGGDQSDMEVQAIIFKAKKNYMDPVAMSSQADVMEATGDPKSEQWHQAAKKYTTMMATRPQKLFRSTEPTV